MTSTTRQAPASSSSATEKRSCILQDGRTPPEAKDPEGPVIGLDSGVRQTLTDDAGGVYRRPDTSALEEMARRKDRHRAKCCTNGSRQWRRLKRSASKFRRKAHRILEEWERHTANDLSQANNVIGLEDLEHDNMKASAKGTASAPGKQVAAKRGLNRSLGKARLGRFHRTIHRRCVRDGTWCVAVHPGGTSITCHACGHRDPKSRKDAKFHCTKCDTQIHADQNAGIHPRRRAMTCLRAFLKRKKVAATGGGDRRPGVPRTRRSKPRTGTTDERLKQTRAALPDGKATRGVGRRRGRHQASRTI